MQKVLIRYLSYALAVFIVTTLLIGLADRFPGQLLLRYEMTDLGMRTSELSPVEVLQNLLLIFCAAVFGWIASRDRLRRPLAIGFNALFLAFLIRELDFFLDFYVLDNVWQVLVALLLSGTVVYLMRNGDRYAQGWRRSWPSAGLALIIGGLILLIPFAQLVGHEALWLTVLGDDYQRVVKVAVEEFIELGAYAIITIGTVEFFYAWSRLPRTRDIEPRPGRRR